MAFTEYKGEVIPFSFEDEAIEKVLKYEGGYNPKDPVTGLPVKYGIDQRANPDLNVANLSQEDAKQIYKQRYWEPSGAGTLPKDLALVHFDATVNQGNAAKRFLEESGGNVDKYLDLRRQHYIQLATANPEKYGSSLKGWLNRLDMLEKDLGSMETPKFKEYDGEILPLTGKPKAQAEPILSPEEQVMSQVGADTTGGIKATDYAKLFGAGAVRGTLGVPEGLEAGAQGIARDTIFKPTEMLEYLADPKKLQQSLARAFGFKTEEKRGETPITEIKEKQQRAVDEVLTKGKIPQLKDLTEFGNSVSEYLEDSVTPEMKVALAESQPTGNLIEAFNTGDFSKLSFGEKPTFAGIMGHATKVFGTSAPAILTAVVTKSPVVGGGFAFGQAGSEGVEEARKYIGDMDFDELNEKSEYFRNLVTLGYSPEQAKEMTIAKAGNTASYMQGLVGALGNQFTANLITGKLSNAKLLGAKTAAGRITKAVAAGAAEDGFQELAEGIATDLGIDKTVVREIGVDSFANLVLGAIGGGGPGFVGGVKGEFDRKGAAAPEERVEPTFREATPEEIESMEPVAAEEFAEAPAIEITGVGQVPESETQDTAAMMAELEGVAPEAPVAEPEVEEKRPSTTELLDKAFMWRKDGVDIPIQVVAERIVSDSGRREIVALVEGEQVNIPIDEIVARPEYAKRKEKEITPEKIAAPAQAVKFQDLSPEDQKAVRQMEVDKNKIAKEKKLFDGFLKRQGIQPSEKPDLGVEKYRRPGIFKTTAPTFDELTSRAIAEGFMVDTGDDVENVAQFREYVSDYLNYGVIRTGPDAAREGQIRAIEDAIERIYKKYEEPEFGLEETTPEQLKAEEARRKAEEDAEIDREMAEKARQSREEIKRRSQAAAGEFELGRTAEEDLTGQRRIDDTDEDIPFWSLSSKEKDVKLYTDNPGGNWLRDKRAASLEGGLNKFGNPARFGAVTGYFKGRNVLVPVDVLSKVKGINAEQQNVRAKDLESIQKIMSDTGRLPQIDGEDYVPFITVYQDGTPYVNEGNHRIMAAKKLGFKYIPVEIRYFNGAEEEDGILSPEKVLGYDDAAQKEGYNLSDYSIKAEPKEESFLFKSEEEVVNDSNESILDLLRDEMISELKSAKQRMGAIQRRFAEKKTKKGDARDYRELFAIAKDLEAQIDNLYQPNTTPEAFLAAAARSLANPKEGITQDVYDVIHTVYKKNPKILDGLRLSIKKGEFAEGQFKPYERLIEIYKGRVGLSDPRVIMHELNHTLEQMMTKEARHAVVIKWRQALEKAANSEKSVEGQKFFDAVNEMIKKPNKTTFMDAVNAMPDESYYQYITPSEYWAVNSEALMKAYLGGAWQRFKNAVSKLFEAMKDVLGLPNRWVIYKAFDNAINGERKTYATMNDYIRGVVPMYNIHRNYLGGQPPLANWTSPDESKIADWVYKLQDKFVDLKDVQKAITEEIGSIEDRFNPYMKEELYHGRTAKRIEDFLRDELLPIIKKLRLANIDVQEFDDFLHHRHAEERNDQIAKVNPNMPDAGSGISYADIKKYFDGLDPKKRATMEKLANDIDNMVKGTQKLLVEYGLEEQSTIDQWNRTYKHYVPLMRDDLDFAHSATGLGQGLATRGKTSKRATGSLKDVVDIFANIAIQRERAIIRGEKARVGRGLYGLAIQNPNPEYWLPVNPDAVKDPEGLAKELISIGLSPADAANFIKEPYTQDVDPKTGLVTRRVNVNNRYADNVFAVRVNGKDRFIFFNPSDPRAMRLVKALKNMDGEQFSGLVGNVANVTRFIASVNTQYNPVFGLWNFTRDVQGAAFNLSTTPIAGKQKEVMAGVLPALRAIYKDLRAERKGRKADGEWVDLFERFEKAGGKTGYRDQFAQSRKKANIIQREMENLNRGNVRKVAGAVMDWLSDYNDAMENAVRLSAFKVALEQGLSEERAASIAKNLTVNFNRKGAWSQGIAALYAFFNAAVQGSTRILETLRGPAGRKIIVGGMMIGVFQALALMMAGFDDDDPPEFLKDKNLIIPYGDGKYFVIPMPLGYSAIPSTGRRVTEMILYGDKIPERVVGFMGMLADAFNPLGSGSFAQMLSPTASDPFVSVSMNRDTFGRPIYREDRSTNPTPGYERSREGASDFSKGLSWLLNYISSGGSEYKKGFISPTADEIDYIIGQFTGGVGREIMKAVETVKGTIQEEEVPAHRRPFIGKMVGDINTPQAVTGRFYRNVTDMAQHENEIKGRGENEGDVEAYFEEYPEARLIDMANDVENEVSQINREIKQIRKRDPENKEAIKNLEEAKINAMKNFNERLKQIRETGE